jgi:ribose 5-phosphate isomerase B
LKVIVGADDTSETVDAVIEFLRERGVEAEVLPKDTWPEVARQVGEAVAAGLADTGVLFCWTGTGTSMMANKVPGVRAALCWEPWIAEGARKWNDANVLVMSLKRLSPAQAVEVLEAWLKVEAPDPDEKPNIERLKSYERGR